MSACSALDLNRLQDLHTSAQEAAGAISSGNTSAAASGKSSGSRSIAADQVGSKAKRQSVLLTSADVLLTCAVQGGQMAKEQADDAAKASAAAVTAAAERCGVPVPQQPVESPVAPPLTPLEQLAWLKLAANAFKAAGWVLEAGQLLLGLGPELDGGKWLAVARKLLKSAADKSAVALMYEQAARQELGLGRISHPGAKASTDKRGTVDDAANAGADDASQTEQTEPADDQAAAAKAYAMAVGLGGMHGSFLTASKLLREALVMYQADNKWADCWRLVNEYEGLRQTLKKEQCDNITLVCQQGCLQCSCWVSATAT